MTAPPSESPTPPLQPDPVVGVNDWGRVSDAWERVFDDVTAIGADLKTVFKGAYQAAAVDPAVDLSDAVGGLAAEQFVGVSERLDRGLAGARAAMGMLGEELHEGGSERLHGEVEGAVKLSLYELGMLMIRMSDKLDGDVPPPRQPRTLPTFDTGETAVEAAWLEVEGLEVEGPDVEGLEVEGPDVEAAEPVVAEPVVAEPVVAEVGIEPLPAYGAPAAHGEIAAGDLVSGPRAGESTEEIPEIDLTAPAPDPDDTVTPVPEPIPVRPAQDPGPDIGRMIRPD